MDLEVADLFAQPIQIGYRLPGRAADGAHGHDDPLGIGRTVVVEQVVIFAGDGVDLLHVIFHDIRQPVIEAVVRLPELEVDIRILDGVPQGRMIGIQSGFPEAADSAPVQHFAEFFVGDGTDLLDLVRGAEAVKEVDKGDTAFDGRQVGDACQVHDLLHAAGGQHGKAGLAAVHHVTVVTENGHGVGAHGTGSHMEHCRLAGAADAVHCGDHQHQALGGGKGGGQRASLQRSVDRADGARLRLHLHQGDRLGKQVFPPVGGPLVRFLRHRRGGGDGIDGGYLREGVGHICRGFVSVRYHDRSFTHLYIDPFSSFNFAVNQNRYI